MLEVEIKRALLAMEEQQVIHRLNSVNFEKSGIFISFSILPVQFQSNI